MSGEGLGFAVGPFNVNLCSRLDVVADGIEFLYQDFEILDESEFVDFRVSLQGAGGLRRWFHRQVRFSFDGYIPFKPLPQAQGFAMFEWGLNWCVANNAHQYLIIHAAVVEKNKVTCILPGTPGSGKSTLCAALVSKGWRLLSDEMAMVSIATGEVVPIPRPISLKNQSIDIIRGYSPEVELGEVVRDTAKGTVSHVCPPVSSVEQMNLPGKAGLVVFPRYIRDASIRMSPLPKADALLKIAENSFNYSVLGRRGFDTLVDLTNACHTFELSYQSLDEAREAMESLL